MPDLETRIESALVSELNDLRKLDLEAIAAYEVALKRLRRADLREQLREFRRDHEGHAEALARLIEDHDGVVVPLPHLPSGALKLALQAMAFGDDRAVLLAFKSNERQVRDRYQASAERSHPPEVAALLSRFAADESRHYDWAADALRELGAGPETRAGRMEDAFEVSQARFANTLEDTERQIMVVAEETRREVKRQSGEHPWRTALTAVGVGVVLSQLGRR